MIGVDCSIGPAATGEFHAVGDACKSGLLYLHKTSPSKANLKPSRWGLAENRSNQRCLGSVFKYIYISNIWREGIIQSCGCAQLLQLFLLLGSQRGDLGTVAEQLVTVESR